MAQSLQDSYFCFAPFSSVAVESFSTGIGVFGGENTKAGSLRRSGKVIT